MLLFSVCFFFFFFLVSFIHLQELKKSFPTGLEHCQILHVTNELHKLAMFVNSTIARNNENSNINTNNANNNNNARSSSDNNNNNTNNDNSKNNNNNS